MVGKARVQLLAVYTSLIDASGSAQVSRASLSLPGEPLHTLKTLPVKDNVLLAIGLMPTQKGNLLGKAEK